MVNEKKNQEKKESNQLCIVKVDYNFFSKLSVTKCYFFIPTNLKFISCILCFQKIVKH